VRPGSQVIGVTGAGKSTFVNYVSGVEMVLDEETGTVNAVDSVAEVGHAAWSMTFKPNVIPLGDGVVIDCPGLAGDTRGAVVDVANGTVVRAVFEAARTVRLVVLAQFHDVYDSKSQGIKSVIRLLSQIVDVATIDASSVLMGLSKAPRSLYNRPLNLRKIREKILKYSHASVIPNDAERRLAERLTTTCFVFEPYELEGRPEYLSNRDHILELCRGLEPVTGVFRTAVVDSSLSQCLKWCAELEHRTREAMLAQKANAAATSLMALARLSRVDDTQLHDARERVFKRVLEWLRQLQREDLKMSVAVTKAFACAISQESFGGLHTLLAETKKVMCEAVTIFATQACAEAETAAAKASETAGVAQASNSKARARIERVAEDTVSASYTDHGLVDKACDALAVLKHLNLGSGTIRRCSDELRRLSESVRDCCHSVQHDNRADGVTYRLRKRSR